ncbi:hypothetical protein SAMN05421688_2700 [Poseidonocella pacifica]|uniref:STAS domain-containing protein n=1 Tax=Poseidonocella pacifica TaxID=871651 RepID=A0A1I0Y1G5_9RHOB|nr:hypothetical protein [Poseidonocella pacifica]SFB06717.1 hypothetical protein SAMN05421688_2700 [Poseidonocella pacifica]
MRYLVIGGGYTALRNHGPLISEVNRDCRNILAKTVPFAERKHLFIDISAIEGFDATAIDVVHYITYLSESALGSGEVWRIAYYAPEESPGFSLARMVEGFSANSPGVSAIHSENPDLALAWLGVGRSYTDVMCDPRWIDVDPRKGA